MLIDNYTRNIVEVIMISFVFLSFVCFSVGFVTRMIDKAVTQQSS